ncbi:MAG TPA: isochorismatase family protein [Geobacteraceae bacterium]
MPRLRELREGDVAQIRGWPPYPGDMAQMDYALREKGWLEEFRSTPDTFLYAVEDGGELIGFTILLKTGAAEAEFRIALRPDKTGLGIGERATFQTLRIGFEEHRLTRIHLIVRKNNRRGIGLYRRAGFVDRGECRREIQGVAVDFRLMEIGREEFRGRDAMGNAGIVAEKGKRGSRPRRALIVIDVQNEYFTGMLPVSHPPGSLENILTAMDAASATGVPVVVVRHEAAAPDRPVFRKGTPAWELHPEVANRPRDLLVEKTLPGSFTGTELEAWLRARDIDTVVISGYMTQMCCDTTARQAFHLGFGVEFLSDATGTLSLANDAGSVTAEELHRAILVTQGMLFSKVMATAEWIAGIGEG